MYTKKQSNNELNVKFLRRKTDLYFVEKFTSIIFYMKIKTGKYRVVSVLDCARAPLCGREDYHSLA